MLPNGMRVDWSDLGVAADKYRPPGGVEWLVDATWQEPVKGDASHVQEDYCGKEENSPPARTGGTQNIRGNQDGWLLKVERLIAEMGNGKEDNAGGLFQCAPTIRS